MRLTIVAGARPNFMKIAPIVHALNRSRHSGISYRLVHTGQHYDNNMSGRFFAELGIPEPHANLNCGSGTQAEQTGKIMIAFEKELTDHKTDLVLVVGDVTSTMACTITAKKMCVKVAHVEAGIRSHDMHMPEEINRMVTDSITDYFFTTTQDAGRNLEKTGIPKHKIFFVGNTMIDTLLKHRSHFERPEIYDAANLQQQKYLVVTLHRPSNVDVPENLSAIIETIHKNAKGMPVVFPIHPRTRKNIEGHITDLSGIYFTEPLPYLQFNYLVAHSACVITDSGGITEETTVMGVPCITMRDNTERPETVMIGTNELIGTKPQALEPALNILHNGLWKKGSIPALWDGKAAERIVQVLYSLEEFHSQTHSTLQNSKTSEAEAAVIPIAV